MMLRRAAGRRAPRVAALLVTALTTVALLASLAPAAALATVDPPAASDPADPAPLAAPPDRVDASPDLQAPVKDPLVDSRVAAVSRTERDHGTAAALDRARAIGLSVSRGRVRVVVETTRPAVAKRSVAAAGGSVEATADGLVQALVAPGHLGRLRGAAGIDYIRAPLRFVEASVGGEGVGATNAAAWHAAGLVGEGSTVAVIDGGFAGLAVAQANGDLPADAETADFCGGGFDTASEHGTAVAEIVHEMAPAARLLLVCIDTEVTLSQAVDWAKSRGADVINHSIGWFNSGRGDGTGGQGTPDATAADAAAAGILWVNAAGNEAQTHWSGTFVDAGDGLHDFGSGDIGNSFEVAGGTTACAFLKWDDWPLSNNDYDLYLVDEDGFVVAESPGPQTGTEAPVEAACFQNDGATAVFFAAILRYEASATPRFDLFVLGSGPIQYAVAAGSLLEPATSPATLAVGAVCWSATTIQPFSSQGPAIDGRTKPDLSGQDAVSGFTYGATSDCGAGGGFAGTSAASPHVAGAAALIASRNPEYGPSQVRATLTAGALDLGAVGADSTFGAGLLRLAAPGTVVELTTSPNPSAVDADVTLTAAVAPATATGTVAFRDVTGGGSIELGSAELDAGVATLTTSFPTGGTRWLVASYAGDGVNPPAVSAPLAHGVNAPVITPTTTSLALTPNPVGRGTTATFTATVTPNPASGSITWIIDGAEAETTPVTASGTASITRTYWELGTLHTVRARFEEGTLFEASESPQEVLEVLGGTSVSLFADRSTAVAGETLVTFTALMADSDAWGSVTFTDTFGAAQTVLGTVDLVETDDGDLAGSLAARLAGVGVHEVVATYGGNAEYGQATSGAVTITTTPDVGVSAFRVGVSYGTFYPYRDGYRDVVAIRGTPGEPVRVSIKVYNGSGRVVRSWSLATRDSPWSVNWNGRTESRTWLPAGRYKVIQRVRDGMGHLRAFTSYTTISNKRLYWYSGSITKYADTGTFAAEGTYSVVYGSNRYYRGVVVDGGYCEYDPEYDEEICDIAVGAHRFALPAAAAYSSIRFAVLGRSWVGAGWMGIENYDANDIDVARTVGSSFTWYTSSAVGTAGHVNGSRVVTGYVWAVGDNQGVVEYQKVRVTFRYARLR